MLNISELMSLDNRLRERRVRSVHLDGTATDPATQGSWRLQVRHSLHDLRLWLEGSAYSEREQFGQCVTLLEEELKEFRGNITLLAKQD